MKKLEAVNAKKALKDRGNEATAGVAALSVTENTTEGGDRITSASTPVGGADGTGP